MKGEYTIRYRYRLGIPVNVAISEGRKLKSLVEDDFATSTAASTLGRKLMKGFQTKLRLLKTAKNSSNQLKKVQKCPKKKMCGYLN